MSRPLVRAARLVLGPVSAVVLFATVTGCGSDAASSRAPGGTTPVAGTRVAGSDLAAGTTAVPASPGTSPPGTTVVASRGAGPSSSSSTPAPSTTATPTPPRQLPVATTTLALVDTSRAAVSHGRTVAPSRALTTTVYYPDAPGPWPLVVFAHGYRIGPAPYARLCRAWAAAGYVVAAPSFPLTDQNVAGDDLDEGDLPQQAGDVRFVIDQLLGAPGSSSALANRIDGSRIGVAGHSDGADTALDVGYFPGRVDARVRAVVAMAPDAMKPPGGTTGSAPLLLEHGDHDTIVPFANSTTVFGQVGAHRLFLVLTGADHLPPVTGGTRWTPILDAVTIDFLDRYVAGRVDDDAAILAAGNDPGTARIATAG